MGRQGLGDKEFSQFIMLFNQSTFENRKEKGVIFISQWGFPRKWLEIQIISLASSTDTAQPSVQPFIQHHQLADFTSGELKTNELVL